MFREVVIHCILPFHILDSYCLRISFSWRSKLVYHISRCRVLYQSGKATPNNIFFFLFSKHGIKALGFLDLGHNFSFHFSWATHRLISTLMSWPRESPSCSSFSLIIYFFVWYHPLTCILINLNDWPHLMSYVFVWSNFLGSPSDHPHDHLRFYCWYLAQIYKWVSVFITMKFSSTPNHQLNFMI